MFGYKLGRLTEHRQPVGLRPPAIEQIAGSRAVIDRPYSETRDGFSFEGKLIANRYGSGVKPQMK
jgi:hypothetical protein